MKNHPLLNSARRLVFLPLFFFCCELWARGGGGGGGHSSGSSGSSHSSGSTYYSSGGDSYNQSSGGGLFLFFVFIIILFIFIFIFFKKAKKAVTQTGFLDADSPTNIMAQFTRLNESSLIKEIEIPADFFQGDKIDDFKKKVSLAFIIIQKSWSEKRLALMRRFISDGVYQRFNAQFTMMNLLEERNPMTNVEVHQIEIVKISNESGYDCVDVAISASAADQFISEKYPQLNSPGGLESFTEYWSFIRRHEFKKGADLFLSEQCPKCSAPLTSKLVESARCPYCGTYLNSGEYDWVLSEITQAEDYGFSFGEFANQNTSLETSLDSNPDFSRQVLEDRASNAFMQILIAQLTKNTDVLKRFCTSSAFEFFKKTAPQVNIAYNRLYTQAVALLKTKVEGNEIRAYVAVKFAFSIVLLDSGRSGSQSEEDLNSETRVLVMMRFKSDQIAKGSIFANACPKCGAAQKDSLSAVCSYCQAPLNDPNLDWVVEDMLDMTELT